MLSIKCLQHGAGRALYRRSVAERRPVLVKSTAVTVPARRAAALALALLVAVKDVHLRRRVQQRMVAERRVLCRNGVAVGTSARVVEKHLAPLAAERVAAIEPAHRLVINAQTACLYCRFRLDIGLLQLTPGRIHVRRAQVAPVPFCAGKQATGTSNQ